MSTWITGVDSIKRQTRDAYCCLVTGQSLWAQAWPTAYRFYARSVCDIKTPPQCGMRLLALYKCYMPVRSSAGIWLTAEKSEMSAAIGRIVRVNVNFFFIKQAIWPLYILFSDE